MAKTSIIARDKKRKKLIAQHAKRRSELRKMMRDATIPADQKIEIQKAFAKLPRNSCPTRLTRRCFLSGRPRAFNRKFGLSRIALRDLALRGELPGVTKSSW